MAAASALSPSPRWPAYLEALRDGLDLASTRDAAALRDALAAVASARASCASRLHREICDAGSLAGAAGEEALAGGGSSRDDADDREATARTPGAKRRGSARPASPGPSRVTREYGRSGGGVTPSPSPPVDQPTLARLVKVGASISEPIVDHREQIRLFAAADDRARRRHHSRTRHSRLLYSNFPSGPLARHQ